MIALGLDGYARGWVAARIDGARRELFVLPCLADLAAIGFDRAGIDIPIGLPEQGPRACDLAARKELGRHASRVFTGARRGLWDFPSHEKANHALKARGEPGVSIQLWNLGPKILEVDALMTAQLQLKIRETHPELVFQRLNFGRALPSKKMEEGILLRIRLLRRAGFVEIKRWIDGAPAGVKTDDILDACACAIAARDFAQGNVLPKEPAPRDAKGLRMQIWY